MPEFVMPEFVIDIFRQSVIMAASFFFGTPRSLNDRMIGFVFSGQGAQFAGMGRDLAEADPDVMALYDRANDVLGFDLKAACFDGPAELLTRSDTCQPAIFTTSMACLAAFKKARPNVAPACLAGLSLGEWTALCAAGALAFDDTLKILQARGRFMQEACDATPGGMLSVMNATPAQLEALCAETGVNTANINSPAQVVLSGARDAVEKARELCAARKIKAVPLQVAGAFHSPLMTPARGRLAVFFAETQFGIPDPPVYANVTGKPHEPAGYLVRDAMLLQVTSTVRWLDCVQNMIAAGVTSFIEFGPGKTLSGLIARISKDVKAHSIQDTATLAAYV